MLNKIIVKEITKKLKVKIPRSNSKATLASAVSNNTKGTPIKQSKDSKDKFISFPTIKSNKVSTRMIKRQHSVLPEG
jgi:hypothetical protein